tara:strand:- start:110 stop:532 length:423 start_codon:yes stop_codon:yes gene_type:complete
MKIKKVRGYIFSRKFLDERVPQHVQNIVIRDYCKNNNLQYLLSSTEYILEDSHLMMQQLMNELNKIDGIVAYSLFQLPKNKQKREQIYQKILKNNKELHFAVEKLKITNKKDTSLIEQIWQIKLTLPLTPDISKIKKYII